MRLELYLEVGLRGLGSGLGLGLGLGSGLRLRCRVRVRLELYLEVDQIAATHLHGCGRMWVARRTVR